MRVDSLSIKNLTTALNEFTNYEIAGVVYGSGFETCVESLYFLEKRFNVAGNSAAVFESVQNKQTFFAALDSLKIPYPETHFSFPNESKNWLSKPLRGQGGVGGGHLPPAWGICSRQRSVAADGPSAIHALP